MPENKIQLCVSFGNSAPNVQNCDFHTRNNNKNTMIVKYAQNALVVFQACLCKAVYVINKSL